MAKMIKLTGDYLREVCEEFAKQISGFKMSDGKLTFSKTVGVVDRKATLVFTERAWARMQMLVLQTDKEIAWHFFARRGENAESYEYILEDVIIYPQEVTGSTVETDDKEYQTWLYGHEDEDFFRIRGQGHSHVNMACSPSGTDTTLYNAILEQLTDDMFYIFVIWNKKGEKWIKIYDMRENVLFETADVSVKILDNGLGLMDLLQDANEKVKTKTYTAPKTGSTNYSYYSNGTYYAGTSYTASNTQKKSEEKVDKDTAPKKESKGDSATKSGKRKGRRKDKNITPKSASSAVSTYPSYYGYDDDDDDDNPYNPYGGSWYNNFRT